MNNFARYVQRRAAARGLVEQAQILVDAEAGFERTIRSSTWMAYDFAILARCTHILMLPRWETSSGAGRELAFAQARGCVVVYSVEELQQAAEEVSR